MKSSEKHEATLQVKVLVEESLVREAGTILQSFGLTQQTAITAFYKQVVKEGKMPFQVEEPEECHSESDKKDTVSQTPAETMDKHTLEKWITEPDE